MINKLNAKQIIEIVRKNIQEEYGHTDTPTPGQRQYDIDEGIENEISYYIVEGHEDIPELGEVVEVDSYGGEGEGDNFYKVYHYVDHDVYIKIQAHYDSFNGISIYGGWEGAVFEVVPKEETVINYVGVN